jgi:hypothetical protein
MNIRQKVRISLPQNAKKLSDLHPDFAGKFETEDEQWSAAAWLAVTKKGAPYMSLQLTRDVPARKLKFAIWRTEHTQPEDPHFESNQEADGRSHHLQAWLLPAGNDFRLELHIESAQGNDEPSKVSAALAATQKRIEAFLSESGAATLPPNSFERPSMPAAKIAQDEDEGPDDVPFRARIYADVKGSRLNRRVF